MYKVKKYFDLYSHPQHHGWGQKVEVTNLAKNLHFLECGHVEYQIKGNEMYNNIQVNILTLAYQGQNHFF